MPLGTSFSRSMFRGDAQHVSVLGEDDARSCGRTSSLLLVMWCGVTHGKGVTRKEHGATTLPSSSSGSRSRVRRGCWRRMERGGEEWTKDAKTAGGPTATTTQGTSGTGKAEPTAASAPKRAVTKKKKSSNNKSKNSSLRRKKSSNNKTNNNCSNKRNNNRKVTTETTA